MGLRWSVGVKSVANGAQKARMAFVLADGRVTPRERPVLLLESTDHIRRGQGRGRLCARSARRRWLGAIRRGRRGGPTRRGRASAKVRLAGHVRGRREVGHRRAREDVKRAGGVHARVVDARIVVIVRAWEGDGLVGGAGLRAADADLRAGGIELRATKGHGEVERDDLVADEVLPWGYVCGECHRDRRAVHCRACALVCVAQKKKNDDEKEKTLRTDVLHVKSGPIGLLANLVNFEPLGGRTIELVAGRGVACSHISHKCTSIMGPLARRRSAESFEKRGGRDSRLHRWDFPNKTP